MFTVFVVHISSLSVHVQTSDMIITFVPTVLRASNFFVPDDWYSLVTADPFFSVAGKSGSAVLPIYTGD